MFFIPCNNWEALSFEQIYIYPEVCYNRYVAAFFDISVLEEVRILYPLSPQQHYNATNTKGFYFLNVLNKIYLLIAFFTLSICDCFTFFIINGIFKLKGTLMQI